MCWCSSKSKHGERPHTGEPPTPWTDANRPASFDSPGTISPVIVFKIRLAASMWYYSSVERPSRPRSSTSKTRLKSRERIYGGEEEGRLGWRSADGVGRPG